MVAVRAPYQPKTPFPAREESALVRGAPDLRPRISPTEGGILKPVERVFSGTPSSAASTVGASSSCGARWDKILRPAGEANARANRTTVSSIGRFPPPPLRSYIQRSALQMVWHSVPLAGAKGGSFNDEILRFARNDARGVGPHTAICKPAGLGLFPIPMRWLGRVSVA